MKHLFLLCLSVLLLASCSSGRYPSALYVADSLSVACPERAVALLDSLRPQMEQEGERVRMYYHLLCVKARDKAYLPHTSDSLVLSVLRYYEDKQDRRHLPEAYYYAGRVASDLGDAPQALDYFQQALDAMPEDGMTYLRDRVVSQMGTLFSAQGLYAEALKMYKKSLQCSEELKDSVGVIYSLRDVAYAYWCLGQNDSVLPCYNRAHRWSVKWGNPELIGLINIQLADHYLEKGLYDSVRIYLPRDLTGLSDKNRNAAYAINAYYYEALGRQDSATYYYTQLLNNGDVYAKALAARYLMQQATLNHASKEVAVSQDTYLKYADSVQYLTKTEVVARMHSLYNYQLRERENASLQKAYASQTRNLLFVSCCLVVALSAFLVYRQYQWRNRKILAARLDRLTRQKEQAEADSRLNRQEIHGLETELAQERQKSREAAAEYQKQLQDMRQSTDASFRLRKEQRTQIQNTDIYRLLEEKASSVQGKADVTAKEWRELERVIRTFDADFLPKLEGLPYSWKPSERLLCLLLRVGFTPSQIGVLLGRPVQTITTMRRRLAERLLDNLKTPKGWDDFICSL
jgi:tetratricopeptide (TPR) repeat protein